MRKITSQALHIFEEVTVDSISLQTTTENS